MNSNPNFSHLLQEALVSDDINRKEHLTQQALEYCNQNSITADSDFVPMVFEKPSYCDLCTIVQRRDLPARKNLESDEGLAELTHAIAHIEFSAIDLALDAVYRFPDMPLEFKHDWLIVAQDEIRHFKMLEQILHSLGSKYGDLPVHSGLFDVSMSTRSDVLDRMAVVHRHYEASGLDVNPHIIKKLENKYKNPIVKSIIDALHLIETEEIDHVYKGDKWFKFECDNRSLEPMETFKQVLQKYSLHIKNVQMNIKARKEAGFSCDELIGLGAKECD